MPRKRVEDQVIKKTENVSEEDMNTVMLQTKIPEFYEADQKQKAYKKTSDKLKEEIKEIMESMQLQDYDVEDLKATLKTVEITKFDEDILLEIIKPLEIEGIIKTREYVDMDALETAIYKGMLDAKILEKSRIITEQKRFSVKMMKLKKEI